MEDTPRINQERLVDEELLVVLEAVALLGNSQKKPEPPTSLIPLVAGGMREVKPSQSIGHRRPQNPTGG